MTDAAPWRSTPTEGPDSPYAALPEQGWWFRGSQARTSTTGEAARTSTTDDSARTSTDDDPGFRGSQARTSTAGSSSTTGGDEYATLTYEVDGRIARITFNRPEQGNAITPDTPVDLAHAVERADLDPRVHVMVVSGRGKGFCGGYDLAAFAEQAIPNHDPSQTWDPMVDYALMSRFTKGYASLLHANKPTVAKIHGFCVAGGTDIALHCDQILISADAKIGYPPTRVWGVPSAGLWAHRLGDQRAKRLLLTGDTLSGREAAEWGLAIEAPEPEDLDARTQNLLARIAAMPLNQLIMVKLALNSALLAQGVQNSQMISTVFDGIARHTREGYAFAARAAEVGFRQAVAERDGPPYDDFGPSTNKG